MLAILAVPAHAGGQGPSDQDLMSMQIEELTRVQVYSASRHLEDARKAPSSVSIITAEDIRRYGWRTLGDALRTLRGFYTSYDRQYTYLGVRGFLRSGDYNSRILLLVNGHRLNENVYGSAPMGAEFPLDLDLVDHIEVVRGPGSSLFGTNAVFGVINVITRKAGAGAAAETAGDAGSFLSRTGRATVMGSRGKASGLFSIDLNRSAGQSTLFFPEFASPATNNGYADNMDGSHFEQAFADLDEGNFRLLGEFSNRVKVFPTASYGTAFNDPTDRDRDTDGYLDASYRRTFSSGTDVGVRVYYDTYNFLGGGDFPTPGAAPTLSFAAARADWIGTEATLTRPIGAQRITAGTDYEYSLDVTQSNYLAGEPDSFRSDESPWLAAIFGEAELSIVPRLIIHAGGRVDWFSSFGEAVSPRAALIYSFDERTALKYIVGKAFRAPNAYEEYYVDGVTITTAPKSLVPEEILSNEVVFEHSFERWLSMTGDGFYNQLKDLIDQVPDGTTGLTYFVNDGRVHAKGLEVEVDAERESGAGARASYTATMVTDDLAHIALTNAPHSQAKFNGTLPTGRWGAGSLELLYVGPLTDVQGTRVPPYFLPSVTFSTKPVWGGWQFSSSLYDASNRRWFSPMGPNDPEDQIQMDGRTWRVKLSYRLPEHGGGRDR
jgi:iron complex outermembrane receptor protein